MLVTAEDLAGPLQANPDDVASVLSQLAPFAGVVMASQGGPEATAAAVSGGGENGAGADAILSYASSAAGASGGSSALHRQASAAGTALGVVGSGPQQMMFSRRERSAAAAAFATAQVLARQRSSSVSGSSRQVPASAANTGSGGAAAASSFAAQRAAASVTPYFHDADANADGSRDRLGPTSGSAGGSIELAQLQSSAASTPHSGSAVPLMSVRIDGHAVEGSASSPSSSHAHDSDVSGGGLPAAVQRPSGMSVLVSPPASATIVNSVTGGRALATENESRSSSGLHRFGSGPGRPHLQAAAAESSAAAVRLAPPASDNSRSSGSFGRLRPPGPPSSRGSPSRPGSTASTTVTNNSLARGSRGPSTAQQAHSTTMHAGDPSGEPSLSSDISSANEPPISTPSDAISTSAAASADYNDNDDTDAAGHEQR